jgi:hypothetical protein
LSPLFLSKDTEIKTFRTVTLPLLLDECEALSLMVGEENKLKAFDNKVVRKRLGLKREEVIGDWRRLHNEELCDLYSLPNINWDDRID